MGCVACINKINNSIQQHCSQQVQECESWLDSSGGRSRVKFGAKTKEEANEIAESVAQAIRNAGFDPCTIESMKVSVKH
jgi:hypothetical protein